MWEILKENVDIYRYKLIHDTGFIYIIHDGSIEDASNKLRIVMYATEKRRINNNCFMIATGVIDKVDYDMAYTW